MQMNKQAIGASGAAGRKRPRVMLAYPPSLPTLREDRCQVPSRVVIAPRLPPMDLLSLAAIAEREGCTCRIADYSISGLTLVDFAADLREFAPDYLLVNVTTPTMYDDMRLCSVAKAVLPETRIVAKGAHFLRLDRDALERYPALDFVIRGEAEATFAEIVTGRDLALIAGVTWRSNRGLIRNADRELIEDLDSLPFPARHLIDNGRYVRPDCATIQGVVRVSRGCPHHCFFCLATPLSGGRTRRRSPDNIISEIRLCMERYGITDFILWSDIFSSSRDWVMDLCRTIRDSGLEFTWSANTRADTMDLEMAIAMKKAGCRLVSMGVESGSQAMLDAMGKGIDLSGIRRTFQMLREAGLTSLAYYLMGLPWETRATLEDTIRFALEIDSDFADFFIAAPLPGTRFYEFAARRGMIHPDNVTDRCSHAYTAAAVDGLHLTREEVTAFQRSAVRRYYLRPHYILKRLQKSHSLRELVNYAGAAVALLKNTRQEYHHRNNLRSRMSDLKLHTQGIVSDFEQVPGE